MKVLIADKFPEKYIDQLKNLGLEVIYNPKLGENDLPEAAKEVDILVVRSTIVNEKAINESKNLSLIVRAGAGVNNIAIAAANKKGIYVSNCPGKNAIAVAELTIGLDCNFELTVPDFPSGSSLKTSRAALIFLFSTAHSKASSSTISAREVLMNNAPSFM